MRCTKCNGDITYKDKVRLTLKNMYKVKCPHCKSELKMTRFSRIGHTICIILFCLLFAIIYNQFGTPTILYFTIFWILSLSFIQPILAKYE